MKRVPLRLQPEDDLRQALETWLGEQQEQAGCVISGIGSLSIAKLRFAGAAGTSAPARWCAPPTSCWLA